MPLLGLPARPVEFVTVSVLPVSQKVASVPALVPGDKRAGEPPRGRVSVPGPLNSRFAKRLPKVSLNWRGLKCCLEASVETY